MAVKKELKRTSKSKLGVFANQTAKVALPPTQSKSTPANLNQDDLNQLAKIKWSSMQTDLKSALNIWQDEPSEEKIKTPDEEQLDKVKTLIEDLKQKLSDF